MVKVFRLGSILFLRGSKPTSSASQQNLLAARLKAALGKNIGALPPCLAGVEESAFFHQQNASNHALESIGWKGREHK